MRNSSLLILGIFLIFCLVFSSVASTQIEAKEEGSYSYLPTKLRLSTQVSTEDRYIFYLDYLLPLYYSQDKTTLFYFNPKKVYSSPKAEELNLGLGFRHIFSSDDYEDFILGVHFFYDKKYSANKAWHYQRGYGLEFLSKPFDFRFNYYQPINDARSVDTTYSFGSSSLIYTNSMEEPLEGFDFELGFPLYPEKLKTRLYLGGFFYDSKLAEDHNG